MTFTIATWNCADGFRKKTTLLNAFSADIMTIQELRKNQFDAVADQFPNAFFQPSNTARGLAVFTTKPFGIIPLPLKFRKSDTCYLGLQVSQPNGPIDILATWVKPVEDYVRPSHRAFRHFFRRSEAAQKIVLGDLNQNAVFDQKRRLGLFSDTLKIMHKNGMRSLYHHSTGEDFGGESRATHFLNYTTRRPYHLDYIFASETLTLQEFQLFPENPWLTKRHSDHLPLWAKLG